MSGTSDTDERSKIAESSEKLKSISDQKNKERSEFRAEIIPYDTCGDTNAPVLAFSGNNINIIFNISKESFRKLAVAVIDHLEADPDFKPSENSAGDNQSGIQEQKKSETSLKSSLKDALRDLDGDNTNDIIDAYEEDRIGLLIAKDTNCAILDQFDSRQDPDFSLNEVKISSHCIGTEPSHETLSPDSETGELKQGTKTIVHPKSSSNDLRSSLADSGIAGSSSKTLLKSVTDKSLSVDERCNEEKKAKGIGICETGNTAVDQQNESASTSEDAIEEINLSAHSIDISYEDCPELKNAWPDIEPFKETEEIPLKELKSLLLNGVLTKYLKLEFSNEFIVIKVSSSSNFLVDAVKYKETMNDLSSKSERSLKDSILKCESCLFEKESESFSRKVCMESSSLTADGNQHDISMSDTKASDLHESENNRQECSSLSCSSELVTEKSDSLSCPIPDSVRSYEPQMSLNIKSKEPISNSTTLNEMSSNLATKEAKNLKSLDLEIKNLISTNASNVEDGISADIRFEHNPEIYFENEKFQKIISLKIEKKLEGIDRNVRGSSPSERLKYTLSDCLKNSFSKTETKETEKRVVDTSEKLLNETKNKVGGSSESSNECDNSQSSIRHFKEDTADKYATKADFKSCGSIEVTEPAHKLESEDNILPNTENKLLNVSKCATTSSEDESNGDLSHNICESDGNANKDVAAIVKSIVSDLNENSRLSSGETDLDLNVSENDVLKNSCSPLKIDEESCENHERISCIIQEDATSTKESEISENDVDNLNWASENRNDVQNYPTKEVEENGCERETVNKDSKFQTSERAFENSVKDENFQQNISTDSTSTDEIVPEEISEKSEERNEQEENSPEKFEEDEKCDSLEKTGAGDFKTSKQNTKKYVPNTVESESSEMEDTKNEEMNGSSEDVITDASAEVVLNDGADSLEPECLIDTSSISSEKTFTEQNSECIDDSIADAVDDTEEKLPENSFASNVDSFMNLTVEACSESMSESGDLSSDDIKSIASGSEDSKDSEKQTAPRKGFKTSKYKSDEVDCAPTRKRTRKAVINLSEDAIPENTEVKNGTISKVHGSTLNVSKYSGRTSPIGRSLRSKSLDPTPLPSKALNKKHSIAESEEVNRRTRAKTPDIISKKDIKTTVRSSPRKLARSSAATESNSTSKMQSTKTNLSDAVPKSRANLDSSVSTSKRHKRNNKD